ncbi:MAG: InlB B-repeat-containing protein [Lachnospiraceae bacterium]|nr:InlB B-repeat-containing protein [Lachnospiraceae bacterium]
MKRKFLFLIFISIILCSGMFAKNVWAEPEEEPQTYTIVYNANNDSGISRTQTATIGIPINLDTSFRFTKTGYTFSGWNDRPGGDGRGYYDGEQVVDLTVAGGSFNLYAQYTPNSYTLSFDANGGSCAVSSLEVTYDHEYGEHGADGKLPVATRGNYNFLGWFTEKTGGSEIKSDTIFRQQKSQTLYAHWQGVDVTVNFDANGGTVQQDSKTVAYGGLYETLPTPDRPGYRFDGWFTAAAGGARIIYSTSVTTVAEHTLYAHWSIILHTVEFNPNGGSCDIVSRPVVHDHQYQELPVYNEETGQYEFTNKALPNKDNDGHVINEGYEFLGWFTQYIGGDKISDTTKVDMPSPNSTKQILYAHWKGIESTVTFDANGGTCSEPTRQVTYATKLGVLPVPVYPGYTFLGWYTEQTGGKQINASTEIRTTEDQTFYAHWTANYYNIKFDGNGGTSDLSAMRVRFGGKFVNLPGATRESYTFAGWYTKDSVLVENGDDVSADNIDTSKEEQTFYAHWNANHSRVTLNLNCTDGTCTKDYIDVDYLGTYEDLPGATDTTRPNYEFAGWYTAATGGDLITPDMTVEIAADTTFYAHWTGKDFLIKFSANGAGGSVTPPVQRTVVFGKAYGMLSTVIRPGYTFEGWYTDPDAGEGVLVTSDTIVSTENLDTGATDHYLYAHWSALDYTVRFFADGGSCDTETKTVTFDQEYGELPVATKTGSDFGGWFTQPGEGGAEVTEHTLVTTPSDHTLYAKWLGLPYMVTFDPCGGYCDMDEKPVYYHEYYGELPIPTMEGHTFLGWYLGPTSGNRVIATTRVAIAAPHTLYAQWSVKSCKVIFDGNGGNWNGSPTRELRRSWNTVFDIKDAIQPKRKRHAFTGWFDDEDCLIPHSFTEPVKTDQLIYAGWEYRDLHGFAMEGLELRYAYTGSSVRPDVKLYDYDYDDEYPLVLGTDYSLSFSNCVNVGIASVTATGKGNYTSKITREYAIVPRDISDPGPFAEEFKAEDIYVTYTGKPQMPAITLYRNNVKLKINKDFKASWVNDKGEDNKACTAPDTYDVTLTGIGNYGGSRTIHFVIANPGQRLIQDTAIVAQNRTYTGGPQETTVSVRYKLEKLIEGADYEVIYPADVTSAGTVTFTVEGRGNYTGSKTGRYKIVGQEIAASWIMGVSTMYPYTGGEIIPLGDPNLTTDPPLASVWTPGGTKLIKGTDYTVNYSKDRINIGTITMTVTGKGKYSGEAKKTYKIVAAEINTLTFDNNGSSNYDELRNPVNYEKGSTCPKLRNVVINGCAATEGVDYTLTYQNNKKPGTATITLTGKGNFKGKRTIKFRIQNQQISDASAVKVIVPDAPYTGKAGACFVKPILVDLRSNQQMGAADYSMKFRYTYKDATTVTQKVGKEIVQVRKVAKEPVAAADIVPVQRDGGMDPGGTKRTILCIEIDGKGGYAGTVKAEFMISLNDFSKERFRILDQYYTGAPIEFLSDASRKNNIIPVGGGKTLPPELGDYEIVHYTNNVKKGTATAYLKGKNKYAGLKPVTFKIVQRKVCDP